MPVHTTFERMFRPLARVIHWAMNTQVGTRRRSWGEFTPIRLFELQLTLWFEDECELPPRRSMYTLQRLAFAASVRYVRDGPNWGMLFTINRGENSELMVLDPGFQSRVIEIYTAVAFGDVITPERVKLQTLVAIFDGGRAVHNRAYEDAITATSLLYVDCDFERDAGWRKPRWRPFREQALPPKIVKFVTNGYDPARR